MAEIHIFSGPMGSGKTDQLMRMLHMYSNVTKKQVLLINFKGDDRGDASEHGASTHMYGDSSVKIPLGKYVTGIRVNSLLDIPSDYVNSFDLIGIDEAQFYPDLDMFVRYLFLRSGLKVYLAGLKFNSENKVFGQLHLLEDIATTSQKFHSICSMCDPKDMVPAGFTAFIGRKDKEVVTGGLDKYQPLCARHYFRRTD